MADHLEPQKRPDTLRDTVPIRPLPKWASRLVVTLAIAAAVALGVLAARMIGRMAGDPEMQERVESFDRMRRGQTATDGIPDSSGVADSDTTGSD